MLNGGVIVSAPTLVIKRRRVTSRPHGRQIAQLGADERRELFLRALTARLGPKARTPLEYK